MKSYTVQYFSQVPSDNVELTNKQGPIRTLTNKTIYIIMVRVKNDFKKLRILPSWYFNTKVPRTCM